ncbi:MAG: c-type cytochrome domain-containing protein, partial [Pirellula staleyi]
MIRKFQAKTSRFNRILVGLAGILFGTGQFASAQELDFSHDVVPILKKHCVACHAGDSKKGGLSFNTREDLIAGGESGMAIELGQSAMSSLIERIESDDPDVR